MSEWVLWHGLIHMSRSNYSKLVKEFNEEYKDQGYELYDVEVQLPQDAWCKYKTIPEWDWACYITSLHAVHFEFRNGTGSYITKNSNPMPPLFVKYKEGDIVDIVTCRGPTNMTFVRIFPDHTVTVSDISDLSSILPGV